MIGLPRSLATLVVALALAGCATRANFNRMMNGTIGQPEAALVTAVGPPRSSYVLNDGSKVLSYRRASTVDVPGVTTYAPSTTYAMVTAKGVRGYGVATTYVPQQSAPISISYSCDINFLVNPSGTIVQWTARGNDCKAR